MPENKAIRVIKQSGKPKDDDDKNDDASSMMMMMMMLRIKGLYEVDRTLKGKSMTCHDASSHVCLPLHAQIVLLWLVTYVCDRSLAEIVAGGYHRVALQFPDQMLHEAPTVFQLLTTLAKVSHI